MSNENKKTEFSSLVSSLHAVPKGDQFVCKCPAHDDSHASLYLHYNEKTEKILFHCFAGCSQQQVFDALKSQLHLKPTSKHYARSPNLPKGIPNAWPTTSILKKQGIEPSADTQKLYTAHYPYRSPCGSILGHVVRYDGHGKKDLIPFFKHWQNTDSWRSGHSLSSGRPLFQLQNIAVSTEKTVLIVEGEKCALVAQDAFPDLCVTTWSGGSKSVSKCDWSPLTGRNVIIWSDFDRAGVVASKAIVKILHTLCPNILAVDLHALSMSDFGSGSDCVDYLEAHPNFTVSDLAAVTVSASPNFFENLVSPTSEITQIPLPSSASVAVVEAASNPVPVFFPLTDVGNASRFIRRFGSIVRYTNEAGWLIWDGKVWTFDSSHQSLRLASEVALSIQAEALSCPDQDLSEKIAKWGNTSQGFHHLRNMLEIAKSHPGVTVKLTDFNSDPWLLNCSNGILCLRTGSLRDAVADDHITLRVPIEFDSSAVCPLWSKFLLEIMNQDSQMVSYLQRAIGYSLTGVCSEQVMFLLWGNGANGKSVFLEVLKSVFSEYATSTSTDLLLLNKSGDAATGSNSIARLHGARFVVGSEVPAGARLNESRVKEMTGEDTMTARFLYKEFFEFTPQFKLWIRSNYRPEISGNDKGVWRRIHTIPFVHEVPEELRDKDLPSKLRAELPGILVWCLHGCLDWQSNGIGVPEEVYTASNVYQRDMDAIGEFLEDCCEKEEFAEVSAALLYESYRAWCKSMGEHPLSQRGLGLNLRERKIFRIKRRDARFYRGYRLKPVVDTTVPHWQERSERQQTFLKGKPQ